MRDKKQGLRVKALLKRESISAPESRLWSHLIQQRVLVFTPYLESRVVVLYSPIRNEVATEMVRDHAFRAKKKVFYPKIGRGNHWDLIQAGSADELMPGRYGILEPSGNEVLSAVDRQGLVVFVPGVAFDLRGNRLGRGRGYYDRILQRLGRKALFVALAYEFQIVEELPANRWDRKVNHIITEKRTINCGEVPLWSDWAP